MDEPVEEQQEVDELEQLAKERDEYLDALQRLKAEFENYKKRTARDQAEFTARATERLVKQLLPVLDDLERALVAASEHEEAKLEEGVELVHRALADALAREGLIEVDTEGEFDPHTQEARSHSRPTRRKAPSSRCCRRATSSVTTCCGPREWLCHQGPYVTRSRRLWRARSTSRSAFRRRRRPKS